MQRTFIQEPARQTPAIAADVLSPGQVLQDALQRLLRRGPGLRSFWWKRHRSQAVRTPTAASAHIAFSPVMRIPLPAKELWAAFLMNWHSG